MKTIEIINDLIDLTEWKTKRQINEELKQFGVQINERVFRLQVERHNEMYFAHIKDDYVAHSPKGYKLTKEFFKVYDLFGKRLLTIEDVHLALPADVNSFVHPINLYFLS